MIVWGRTTSINVQKVLWLLSELNLPFERIDLGGQFGGLDAPDYRALNPTGRIPTLADGSVVVWESNAILRYLAGSYGDAAIWGETWAERARADQWMEWFQNSIYPDFITAFYQCVRLPAAERDPDKLADAGRALTAAYTLLDGELQTRGYVAGDHFTIGDIPVAASLYRYYTMGLDQPDLPALWSYYKRLATRPAYKEVIMTSYESLRVPEPT